MSARRWCVTVQHDLGGPLSSITVTEVADGELGDFIRALLNDGNVLHVGIHTDLTAAELRRRLHHLGEDQAVQSLDHLAGGAVN